MVIGYYEGVNRLVIIDNENKRHTRKLAVKGINKISDKFYTYYNMDCQVHIINMDYVKSLKLYKDKELIFEL